MVVGTCLSPLVVATRCRVLRSRFDDDQSVAPSRPQAHQGQPEGAACFGELGAADRTLVDGELLLQDEVLDNELASGFQARQGAGQQRKQRLEHGEVHHPR